jgi:hypothetical protein
MKDLLKKIFGKHTVFDSSEYWENRYQKGGNSGDGSYGRLANFKADYINSFLRKKIIDSAIEFGCGDGNQLSLINYPQYLGLDVSQTVIKNCGMKFRNDLTKSFLLYDPHAFFNSGFLKADLTVSLDVIYHIVERSLFEKYLLHLFGSSSKYVLIYSTNYEKAETTHVVHRNFTSFVNVELKKFALIDQAQNPYQGNGEQQSDASFFVFERKSPNS